MGRFRRIAVLSALLMAGPARADSTYVWKTTTDPIYEAGDPTKVINGVTAYLIDADVLSQQSILTGVLGGESPVSLSAWLEGQGAVLSSATVKEGLVNNTSFTHTSQGTDGHAFFVLQSAAPLWQENTLSALYFSGYSTITPVGEGYTGTLVLNAQSSSLPVNYTTEFLGSTTAGDGGGWYAVIPEPTCGVLWVFGLAVLGLKRKRRAEA